MTMRKLEIVYYNYAWNIVYPPWVIKTFSFKDKAIKFRDCLHTVLIFQTFEESDIFHVMNQVESVSKILSEEVA